MTYRRRAWPLFLTVLALAVLGVLLVNSNPDRRSPQEANRVTSVEYACGSLINAAVSHDPRPQGNAANTPLSNVPREGPVGPANEVVPADSPATSDLKGEPYTASNRPKLPDIKNLPVGGPREPAPPEYSSNLDEEQWQVRDATPNIEYRRRLTKWVWGDKKKDAPRRLVRGRVFTIIGSERIPLSGVLVVGGWNRTFTDSEGRYEMLSTFWEPSEEDKQQGQRYRFELFAQAPGYIDLRGRHTYSNLDDTGEGIDLYLVRRDSHLIRINFENPQAAGGPVTVVLARNDSGSPDHPGFAIDWDEKFYIIAEVDPQEETWFTVPLRYYDTVGETRFGLRSVSAPNVLADVNYISPSFNTDATANQQETVYRVRLLVEDTVTVTGTATDMRTGKPIPHARVYGPGATEFTMADEDGRFELITSKTPRGPRGDLLPDNETRFLHVSDERYATMSVNIRESDLHADGAGGLVLGPGGNLTGPWTFQLRPWVEATIDCTFLAPESLPEATLELMFDVVDALPGDRRRSVDADGLCRFPRIPWGTETIRLATRIPFGSKELKVEPASWDGEEPYRLTPRE